MTWVYLTASADCVIIVFKLALKFYLMLLVFKRSQRVYSDINL